MTLGVALDSIQFSIRFVSKATFFVNKSDRSLKLTARMHILKALSSCSMSSWVIAYTQQPFLFLYFLDLFVTAELAVV
jgi:hypothetical protein